MAPVRKYGGRLADSSALPVSAAIMLYLLTSLIGVAIYQIILKRCAARSRSASPSA